ncbi:uncharacterized protein LOC110724139 [Chenopodium quinoa]|uniref:uncharacterized protein LOC110724139 n=1 Tax=Chenopodium quinoa TaxID=63459 RepID=UPI000B7845D1|nr:uncharacterized protein LOC110724139 [Chenopodium quinoa]
MQIFMPVLHNGKWTLYVARTEEKLVVVFDTKHYSQESYHKTLLPSVLRYTVKVVLIITKSKSLQMESWKVMTFNNIPTEMKPQDSGMLCILFMMIILDDVDMWMHWYKDNEWIYKQQVCSLILTDEVNELHGSMWDLVNAEDP